MPALRSETMVRYWTARFVRGQVEAGEMERGIDRALRGEVDDGEFLAAAREEGLRSAQSLSSFSGVLKSLYVGPVAG